MNNSSFEKYWKDFGQFHHEILKNNDVSEQDFYNLCKKIWEDSESIKKLDYDAGHTNGWQECEQHHNIKQKIKIH